VLEVVESVEPVVLVLVPGFVELVLVEVVEVGADVAVEVVDWVPVVPT